MRPDSRRVAAAGPMNNLFSEYKFNSALSSAPGSLFPAADDEVLACLVRLYEKYASELRELSLLLAERYQAIRAGGFQAPFADIEGELLYMVLREAKPELVYEISPNAGFSTNYVLAALTRNCKGTVEAFEIATTLNGRPTYEVIVSHLTSLCDPLRYRLHLGDARETLPERLALERPDFIFIDSSHEAFFAAFYFDQLLSKFRGTVFIHDIVHEGPRPEPSSEAAYVLARLQRNGSGYLSVSTYEAALQGLICRKAFSTRFELGSSAIFFTVASAPASESEASPISNGQDDSSLTSQEALDSLIPQELLGPATPLFYAELLALQQRPSLLADSELLTSRALNHLGFYDSWQKSLLLEIFFKLEDQLSFERVLFAMPKKDVSGIFLPVKIAGWLVSWRDDAQASDWLEWGIGFAWNRKEAVGYRHVLQAVALFMQLQKRERAQILFDQLMRFLEGQPLHLQRKAHAEVKTFLQQHSELEMQGKPL